MRRYREPRERPRRSDVEGPIARDFPLGVEMEVRPKGDKWRWSAWYTFGGCRSMSMYSEGSTRWHPEPYMVAGVHRDQDEAWRRARESADLMRSRIAAVHDEVARTVRERAA